MRSSFLTKAVLAAGLCAAAAAQSGGSAEHWVSTWATAQQLVAGGRPGGPPADLPASFANQTVRMIAKVSVGGRRVRIELSNMIGAQALEIGAAHIAVYKGGGAIIDGTDRMLSFGGSRSFTIAPGVVAFSDPVDLEVAPLSGIAVSLYLPHDTGAPTNHMLGLHTAYISKGDVTASGNMPESTTMF